MSPLDTLHDKAMEVAFLADLERRRGNEEQAAKLFDEALELELRAIAQMTTPIEPTWSILHRSAGWLALDCNNPRKAEQLAARALSGAPPSEIAEELRDLWEQVNFRRHLELKGVTLGQDELQLSLSGDAVGFGFIEADEFFSRGIDSLKAIYRIVERKHNKRFRERGPSGKDIKDKYSTHISVPRAASFSVTLKLGAPEQLPLPGIRDTAEVIDEFMTLMELVNFSRIAEIRERISDTAYTRNFLGLAKKIAPDGNRIRQVGFTVLRNGVEKSVSITRTSSQIKIPYDEDLNSTETEYVELEGTLGYADAIRHNSIKVIDADGGVHTLRVPEGMMNDIVRPLWDLFVTVRGVRKNNVIELVDIDHLRQD